MEAEQAAGRRATVDSFGPDALLDSSFLNKLQGDVNGWIRDIQNVTKLTRDVASGTASQEINFWLSMETALSGITEQMQTEPVQLVLDILNRAKRFQPVTAFKSDTGIKDAGTTGAWPTLLPSSHETPELTRCSRSAQLQHAHEGLPAQRPALGDRPAQDRRSRHRHLQPHQQEAPPLVRLHWPSSSCPRLF